MVVPQIMCGKKSKYGINAKRLYKLALRMRRSVFYCAEKEGTNGECNF